MTAGLISHTAKKVDLAQVVEIAHIQAFSRTFFAFFASRGERARTPASLVDVMLKNKIYNIIKDIEFMGRFR